MIECFFAQDTCFGSGFKIIQSLLSITYATVGGGGVAHWSANPCFAFIVSSSTLMSCVYIYCLSPSTWACVCVCHCDSPSLKCLPGKTWKIGGGNCILLEGESQGKSTTQWEAKSYAEFLKERFSKSFFLSFLYTISLAVAESLGSKAIFKKNK